MPKKEASSPAVATESLLLSEVIGIKENRDVMTLDNLSTFVQRNMLESIKGKQATLTIHGVLVDILCEIVLEVYEDFVTCNNNNNKILCVNILKLLHGRLKALILCY